MKHYNNINCTYVNNLPEDVRLSSSLFEEIWELHPAERKTYKLYGKEGKFPRYSESYGKSYKFTGSNHEGLSISMHPLLERVIAYVNREEDTDVYNQVLVNWYRDGDDYINMHSDNEKTLRKMTKIYSFSYGDVRTFKVAGEGENEKINLENNSLVIMGKDVQQRFKHGVPKKRNGGRRINITVRAFI